MRADVEPEIVQVELADDAARQDFLAQCDRAARLSGHPHIVTIHDFGLTPEGAVYLTTEPPPGPLLADTLASEGAFTLAAALRITISLAGALESAHQAGFVHCAVSPARVVLAPGREPLLAHLMRSDDGRADSDASDHAPPEVLHGGTVTPASDVYALASTCYTMLAGRTPQAAYAHLAAGTDVAPDGLPPIGRRNVPPEVEEALARALVADPGQRTPSAAAFAEQLQAVQRQQRHPITDLVVHDISPPSVEQPPPVDPAAANLAAPSGDAIASPAAAEDHRWWRSSWVYAGGVVAVALVVGVVVIVGSLDESDAGDPESPGSPAGATGPPETTATTVPGETEPAEDEGGTSDPPTDEADGDPSDTTDAAELLPPENLTAVESVVGVQLDWDGDEAGRYVVLVLPDGAEPWFLPERDGLSQLVPVDLLEPDVGYCFAVAHFEQATSNPSEAAEEADDTTAFSNPACIRDATPD